MPRPSAQGFTLSEVLIALALLGVIAAFSIPKVLQSAQNRERDAILRESIAMLSDVTYTAILTGEAKSMADFNTYLASHLNTSKICPSNHITEDCYPDFNDDDPAAAYILSNGVAIVDVDTFPELCAGWPARCYDNILLDYNGKKPPNVYGEDRVQVSINVGPQVYLNLNPGQVGLDPSFSATNPNTLLFQELTR